MNKHLFELFYNWLNGTTKVLSAKGYTAFPYRDTRLKNLHIWEGVKNSYMLADLPSVSSKIMEFLRYLLYANRELKVPELIIVGKNIVQAWLSGESLLVLAEGENNDYALYKFDGGLWTPFGDAYSLQIIVSQYKELQERD